MNVPEVVPFWQNNPFKYIYYSHYYSRLFIVKYFIIFQISIFSLPTSLPPSMEGVTQFTIYCTAITTYLIYKKMSSNKKSVILCDDYEDATYITGVKKAVDKFVKENNLKLELIKKRFAKITV